MNSIENWLLGKFPHVDIKNEDGDLYLRRFFLIGKPSGSSVSAIEQNEDDSWKLLLHIFYRSDEGKCLHDHRWPFITMILWGGYWEVTEKIISYRVGEFVKGKGFKTTEKLERVMRWKWPTAIMFRRAEHRHMVKLKTHIVRRKKMYGGMPCTDYTAEPRRCWTLLWRGKGVRPWGFWIGDKFVHWMRYKRSMCD